MRLSAECLPLSQLPAVTRLYADYLTAFERVSRYYGRPPLARDWFAEEAKKITYADERRAKVADVLGRQNKAWGASPETLESIGRLRRGAAVIVTGQQVGLFGGPAFAIYKAISAIKLAAEATRQGTDCVPVFWLATEDHDLAEVNHTTLLAADGSLHPVETPTRGHEAAPIGEIRFGAEIEPVVAQAVAILGASEATDLLRASYRPGETFGSAFARLFSGTFKHSGVILLDASDPELHRVAQPIYAKALASAEKLDQQLLERERELEKAGYHAQVKVTPESTLLFIERDGARRVVHRANGTFKAGDAKLSKAELEKLIAEHPEQVSASVLLRPVVQDWLLPTLAYVGGPAEVAYFAQAAIVYEQLLGRVTPVLPRFSATLVEPKVQRILDKYGLGVADALRGPDALRETIAAHALPTELNDRFQRAAKELDESLAGIKAALQRLDPTLVEASEKAESKMRHQLQTLEQRAARAQARRTGELEQHVRVISDALNPHKTLQERQVAGLSFVARYGTELLLKLFDAAELRCPDHQVIRL
jgi:bacillithiol synthase